MEDFYQLRLIGWRCCLTSTTARKSSPEGSKSNRRGRGRRSVDTDNSFMVLHDEFRDALLLSDTGQYLCDPRLQLARGQIADWVPLQEAGYRSSHSS